MLETIILAAAIGYDTELDINQAMCLTEAVYEESRDQPIKGMIAVAVTIKNRVKSNKFPNSVCEVVNQSHQFSYTLNKREIKYESLNSIDKEALSISIKIALQTLSGAFDGVHTSLHYYNPSKANPLWAKKFNNSFTIKDHKWVF